MAAFSPIELTTISRTQDFSTIKHNEDSKAFVDQSQIGKQMDKNQDVRAHDVVSGENAQWQNRKFDARDKGSNEYNGNGGGDRKKKSEVAKVVVKKQTGFDMKI